MGLRNALRLRDTQTAIAASLDDQHGGGSAVWGGSLPWVTSVAGPTAADYAEAIWSSGAAASRHTAMQVPAFAQGVASIAGTCGTFPFRLVKDRQTLAPWGILAQPDPDQPASVTWTRLYEDMVLYPYGWLRVTDRYATPSGAPGFPRSAVYEPYEDVQVDPDSLRVFVRGRDHTADMLRFDSPTAPGALVKGRRILTTAVLIEEAVRRFARMDIPSGFLRQTAGPDMTDTQIQELLNGWELARLQRTTGFLNPSVDYETVAFNPEQLQLTAARDANAVDIARLLNLPPMQVNATTNGALTYSTTESQGRMLLNQTLTPFLTAVVGRLSMPDITPRGTTVVTDLDAFLRSDAPSRAQVYAAGIAGGWLTVDDVRAAEGLPPLPGSTP